MPPRVACVAPTRLRRAITPGAVLRQAALAGALLASLASASCGVSPRGGDDDTAGASASKPVATRGPDDPAPTTADITAEHAPLPSLADNAAGSVPRPGAVTARIAFDVAQVPETTVRLPPFPLVSAPPGLEGHFDRTRRDVPFAREHMIAGDRVIALEGRVFRDRYDLAGDARRYSVPQFHQHYAEAIRAFGGARVSRAQYSPDVLAAFGGRDAVQAHYHGICADHRCENHTYLVRRDGRQYWIQVSSGGSPPRGQVTVLEHNQ